MAIPPRFAAAKLPLAAKPAANPHTIELYLDYACPFSAKMFRTLHKSVVPAASAKPYAARTTLLFRQQIQPWHPSSTLMHEAGVAVLRAAPDRFWEFSAALFEQQTEFFDVNVVREGRNETYRRLARVAAKAGVDEERVFGLLRVPEEPAADGGLNIGNAVTDDLKVLVKIARLSGVHVSPTVLFDGVVENSISSSFTAEQWDEWLQKNCT